jgi:hypothetical protein
VKQGPNRSEEIYHLVYQSDVSTPLLWIPSRYEKTASRKSRNRNDIVIKRLVCVTKGPNGLFRFNQRADVRLGSAVVVNAFEPFVPKSNGFTPKFFGSRKVG